MSNTAQYDKIAGAGAETLAVVAAPGAGKRIRVLSYHFTMSIGTATWKSASTAISGAMTGTILRDNAQHGVLVCAENEALNLTTSAAAALGHLTYMVEDA